MVIWIVLIIGFSALIIFQIGFGKDVGRFEDSFKQISFDKFSLAYDSDDRAEEEKEEGEYGGKMEERKDALSAQGCQVQLKVSADTRLTAPRATILIESQSSRMQMAWQ